MQDLYSVLGLSRHASSEVIRAAYWALVKRSHPDVNAGDEEAERRTKEFNRAYETLSNPEERAAYDLELARLRTEALRGFWTAAATGAATFILTAGVLSVTVKWTHHAQIHQGGEPALFAGDARNETLTPGSDTRPVFSLKNSDRSSAPSKPVSTPLAESPGEPPQLKKEELASTASRDGSAQALDENAAPHDVGARQPTPVTSARGEPQPSEQVNASPPEGAKQPTSTIPRRDQPQFTERTNASSPEVGAKQSVPASILAMQKKSKRHVNITESRRAPTPSKTQGSDRERGLVSNNAMAMRFPSADEPYVNLGARNR